MIKTHANETPAAAVSERRPEPIESRPSTPPPEIVPRPEPEAARPRFVPEHAPHGPELRREPPPREHHGNGAQAPYLTPQPSAAPERTAGPEARRTLHLSLGGNSVEPAPRQPQPSGDHPPPQPAPVAPQHPRPAAAYNAAPAAAPVRMLPDQPRPRDAGGIDHALRERVEADLAAFLAAFDNALAGDTAESRASLREATDRLLRAGARTRIELERLEARVPLPPRDRREADVAEWRQR